MFIYSNIFFSFYIVYIKFGLILVCFKFVFCISFVSICFFIISRRIYDIVIDDINIELIKRELFYCIIIIYLY